MIRNCEKCGKKIFIFAWWFGIRICEECEMKPLNDLIKYKKQTLKIMKKELEEDTKAFNKQLKDFEEKHGKKKS